MEQAKNQTGHSLIFLVVGILVLLTLGGAYLLGKSANKTNSQSVTQSPIPQASAADITADWKTYSNPSLGFSFSYPKELSYLYDQFAFNQPANPEGNLILQNYDGSSPRTEQSTDFQLVIEAYNNRNQTTLENYVKDPNKVWNLNNTQSFTPVTIGGEQALKGLAIQKNAKVPTVWVSHKGFILTIYLETPKSDKAGLFDQILSTVKFIDQNQTEDMSNWKTYSNGAFSFKYPSNWQLSENNGPLGKWVSVKCSTCSSNQVDYFQVSPININGLDDYINHPIGTSDFKRIKLDNKDAVKAAYAGSAQAGGSSIKVAIYYLGAPYEIDMRYGGLLNISSLSNFPDPDPDILSTFKFAN